MFKVSAIDDKRLQSLHGYWTRKRGQRAMPSRGEIDPLDLSPLLGNLFLLDVGADARAFRFRLAGSNIVDTVGMELTGACLAGVSAKVGFLPLLEQCKIVVSSRAPSYLSVLFAEPTRRLLCRQLLLPLSSDDAQVEIILGAALYSAIAPDQRQANGASLSAG